MQETNTMATNANEWDIAINSGAPAPFNIAVYLALRWNIIDRPIAQVALGCELEPWQVQWLLMLLGGNIKQIDALIDTLYREYELWQPSQSNDEAQT